MEILNTLLLSDLSHCSFHQKWDKLWQKLFCSCRDDIISSHPNTALIKWSSVFMHVQFTNFSCNVFVVTVLVSRVKDLGHLWVMWQMRVSQLFMWLQTELAKLFGYLNMQRNTKGGFWESLYWCKQALTLQRSNSAKGLTFKLKFRFLCPRFMFWSPSICLKELLISVLSRRC